MTSAVDSVLGTFRKEGDTSDDRDRLRREATVLAAAAHPGIVRLIGTEGGDPPTALVLRRVDGRALADTPIDSLEVLAGLGAAAATTLADLHDLGFVHRAICASHILVDEEGRPVLCGFASACRPASPSELAELGRQDVRALAEVLLARVAPSADSKVRAVLSLAAGTRARSRRCDARWLARQLVRRVPASRLSPPCPPEPPSSVGSETSSESRGRRWSPARATLAASIGAAAILGVALVARDSNGGRPGHPQIAEMEASVPCPAVDLGCGPVGRPGGVISTSAGRFRLSASSRSTVVVVGRWDCSPDALPALVDVATGNVWVFGSWPGPGRSETATLLARVHSATGLRVLPTKAGCDLLRVPRSDGPAITIDPIPR